MKTLVYLIVAAALVLCGLVAGIIMQSSYADARVKSVLEGAKRDREIRDAHIATLEAEVSGRANERELAVTELEGKLQKAQTDGEKASQASFIADLELARGLALEIYPETADESSELRDKMERMDSRWEMENDARHFSPIKPVLLAHLAAQELGVAVTSETMKLMEARVEQYRSDVEKLFSRLEQAEDRMISSAEDATELKRQRDALASANRKWVQQAEQESQATESPSQVIGGEVHSVFVNGRPMTVIQHDQHNATIMGPGGRSATATTMGNATYINGGIHDSDR